MGGRFRVVLDKAATLAGRKLKRRTAIAQCTAGEGLTGDDVADALVEGLARIVSVGSRKMVKPETVVIPTIDLVTPREMAEAVAEPPEPVEAPEGAVTAVLVSDQALTDAEVVEASAPAEDEESADEDAPASDTSDEGA